MGSREPSAVPSSGGDTIDDQAEDVKPSIAELDRDDSAADLPKTAGTPSSVRSAKKPRGSSVKRAKPKKGTHVWVNEGPGEGTEDEANSKAKRSGSPDADGRTQGTAVGTRRQANGTVGSVYSGSKVRHIKKPDGTPLWRKEIQYEFLRLVIEDTQPVFTRISDGKKGCNFADIYIDCMARSSKTSKILKDRLQVDRQAAQNMAMICLLVNVGRMNTTLNFFPEMRAQLRTYHSIPSLQAYKSQKDYKSLQDAPRLKSILKGASEDTDEPRTILTVKQAAIPRTNPVNLIFVLSQFAPEVAEAHFVDKVDFFDLAIRSTISSKSRARAFLWLMWWYLESSHDRQSGLNNPFGPGEFKEDQDPSDPREVPQLVPRLINITDEEGDAENVDPEEEKAFAEKMTRERKRIMTEVANSEADPSGRDIEHKGVKRLKKGARDFDDESDADSLRASPGIGKSPAGEGVMGMIAGSTGQADSIDDDWEAMELHPGRGRYKRVKGKNTPGRSKARISEGPLKPKGGRTSNLGFDRGTPDTVGAHGTPQPLPPGTSNHTVFSQSRSRTEGDGAQTKSRARTGYQRQLEEHKNSRIEWLLRKKRRDTLKEARGRRENDRWLTRVVTRLQNLDATYDSEEDEETAGLSFVPPTSSQQTGAQGRSVGGLLARRVITDESIIKAGSDKREALDTGVDSRNGAEEDDYGEEAESWVRVFKRAKRRLQTWSGEKDYEIYLARRDGKRIGVNGNSSFPQPDSFPFPAPRGGMGKGGRASGRSTAPRRSGAGTRVGASAGASRRNEISLNDEILALGDGSDDEDDRDDQGDVDMTMDVDDDQDGQDGGDDSDIDMDKD